MDLLSAVFLLQEGATSMAMQITKCNKEQESEMPIQLTLWIIRLGWSDYSWAKTADCATYQAG